MVRSHNVTLYAKSNAKHSRDKILLGVLFYDICHLFFLTQLTFYKGPYNDIIKPSSKDRKLRLIGKDT